MKFFDRKLTQGEVKAIEKLYRENKNLSTSELALKKKELLEKMDEEKKKKYDYKFAKAKEIEIKKAIGIKKYPSSKEKSNSINDNTKPERKKLM